MRSAVRGRPETGAVSPGGYADRRRAKHWHVADQSEGDEERSTLGGARPSSCLARRMRGIPNVIRSPVGGKFSSTPPSVEAVRPSHCPNCGELSLPVGGPVQLHGHGVRSRQLRGPATPSGPPSMGACWVRRFLCQLCGVGCTVVPATVLPRRLFSACAIGLALGLWGLALRPAGKVRLQVSPWSITGATAEGTWSSLRRWAGAIRNGQLFETVRPSPETFSLRQVAARAASTLAACTESTAGPLWHRAFLGALAP